MVEYVFRIKKKITDMENPSNNSEETTKIYVESNESFQEDGNNGHIFKLLSGNSSEAKIEHDRHYLVKDEHKGNDYTTALVINEPKQITSMWGKNHTTLTVTYLGVEGVELSEEKTEPLEPIADTIEEPKVESTPVAPQEEPKETSQNTLKFSDISG